MKDPLTSYLCTLLRLLAVLVLLPIETRAQDKPSRDSVIEYAQEISIKYPLICQAQANLETAHYTSYGCTHRNNLFGFGGRHHYMRFECWKESIDFYKRYQTSHHQEATSKRKWFRYVSLHFSHDHYYGHKLLSILGKNSLKATFRVNLTNTHSHHHEDKTRTTLRM